jgi:hypothetical protein
MGYIATPLLILKRRNMFRIIRGLLLKLLITNIPEIVEFCFKKANKLEKKADKMKTKLDKKYHNEMFMAEKVFDATKLAIENRASKEFTKVDKVLSKLEETRKMATALK